MTPEEMISVLSKNNLLKKDVNMDELKEYLSKEDFGYDLPYDSARYYKGIKSHLSSKNGCKRRVEKLLYAMAANL